MYNFKILAFLLAYSLLLLSKCNCAENDDFTYMGEHGPSHWAEEYSSCSGKHQSPININLLKVHKHNFVNIEFTGFNRTPASAELFNNAHTVVLRINFTDQSRPIVRYGPLDDEEYRFSQLHFHWGANDSVGSEDRINNHTFPAELHMVLYNVKYKNSTEALNYPDGVAVLAFFYALQEYDNPKYEKFVELLGQVQEANTKVLFKEPPTLFDLMPHDTFNYFTYIGSLTTPPCSEDVTWIDFAEPIRISEKQLIAFRQLRTYTGQPLIENYRPLQPLNNRLILQNVVFEDTNLDLAVPLFDIPQSAPGKLSSGTAGNLYKTINKYWLLLLVFVLNTI